MKSTGDLTRDPAAWDQVVLASDGHFLQSWGWGETGPRYRRYYEDRYASPWWDDEEPRRGRRGGWWNSPWDDPYERGGRENPEVVESFRAAMSGAMGELTDNRERLVELVPTYTQVPAEVVEQV